MSLLVIAALAIALGLGLWRGGSLEALADTRLRWVALLAEGLLIQLVFDLWDPPGLSRAGALAVLLISNAAVAAFLMLNRQVPGMLLIAVGVLLNTVVITANQAMPVSVTAAAQADLDPPPAVSDDLKHERLDSDTRLAWLADVIPVPGVKEVLSVGDVVLACGVARLVYMQTTSRKRARSNATSG